MEQHDRVSAAANALHAQADPQELQEWCQALDGVLSAWGAERGRERACEILDALLAHARERRLPWRPDRKSVV